MKKYGERKAHKIHLSDEEILKIIAPILEAHLDISNISFVPIKEDKIKYKIFYEFYQEGIWHKDYFLLSMNDFSKLIKMGLSKKYREILIDIIVKPTKIKYNIYYKGLNWDNLPMIRALERKD